MDIPNPAGPWTVDMLAAQLMATNQTLATHMAGCEAGQLENARVIREMSEKVGTIAETVSKVDRTVGGYKRVIDGGAVGLGRVLAGVAIIVGGGVAMLAIQNVNLHKDTATKVEATASTVATVTAKHDEATEQARDQREQEILALLKQQQHHH